jgi:cytochrome b subunit of formate dehydrogenase
MTPFTTRRLLHAAHVVATLVLLATGFLIQWPDLRAQVVGGYGRELAEVHVWMGWAFAAAPAAALALAAQPLLADLGRRIGSEEPFSWRKAHVVITVVAGVLLTLTGIALWVPGTLPVALLDASLEVHIWATWVLTISLPVHLVVARGKIVERVRIALGGEPPPLFEFADDDDEEPA